MATRRCYRSAVVSSRVRAIAPPSSHGFCKVDQDRFGLTKQRVGRHLSNPSSKLLVVGPQSVDARDKQEGRLSFRPEGAAHTSPGCNPGYPRPPPIRRSEGTPQRVGLGRRHSYQEYAAFLQNAGGCRDGTQGVALGWYAVSRWDTRSRSRSPNHSHPAPTSSSHVRSFRLPVPDFAKALGQSPERRSWRDTRKGRGVSPERGPNRGWSSPRHILVNGSSQTSNNISTTSRRFSSNSSRLSPRE